MQFYSINAFFAMGCYGFYVWLSFGIASDLLISLVYSPIVGHKKVIKNIALRQQRENKLHQLRKQRNDIKNNPQKEVTQ